ncbi:hypothetical protein Ancab_028418, partial [Ancistrocladus abbreviatus]
AISVAEELFKARDWSATTREAKEGVFVSPSSPSTSISVVPDSFDNIFASEQQRAAVTASVVVAEFSKFKPGKNELANHIPIDSRPADGMETTNGRKLDPFQEASCSFEGASRLSKSDDVDLSKSLGRVGHPARNTPLFLSGPERPNGGPSSIAQVQDYNREGVSARPGIRP